MFEEFEMQSNINTVIETYHSSWCSVDEKKVIEVFNASVLNSVELIYSFVSKYFVDWKIDSMDTVLEKLEKDIKSAFPFLSDKSITILKRYFTYQWK